MFFDAGFSWRTDHSVGASPDGVLTSAGSATISHGDRLSLVFSIATRQYANGAALARGREPVLVGAVERRAVSGEVHTVQYSIHSASALLASVAGIDPHGPGPDQSAGVVDFAVSVEALWTAFDGDPGVNPDIAAVTPTRTTVNLSVIARAVSTPVGAFQPRPTIENDLTTSDTSTCADSISIRAQTRE